MGKISCGDYEVECYPYTFSPLLLFADGYFDKGYSNYNSVARFFQDVLDVDMLENVLYDRKNMLYEDLLEYVTTKKMLVTCCIDSHFTAFQILGSNSLIYYDPLKASLGFVNQQDMYRKFVLFYLLKCSYGDSTHIQENKSHYVGEATNPTRRVIYKLWQNINKMEPNSLDVRPKPVGMNLRRYLLINAAREPRYMSTPYLAESM